MFRGNDANKNKNGLEGHFWAFNAKSGFKGFFVVLLCLKAGIF